VHDPTEREQLAYLAAAADGTPIYLNRTVVDADLVVLCGRVGLDPVYGFAGGLANLMPGLAAPEGWRRYGEAIRRQTATEAPGADAVGEEMEEVAWLLGLQYAVLVLGDVSDRPIRIWSGEPHNVVQQSTAFAEQWGASRTAGDADLVILGIDGGDAPGTLAEGLVAFGYARDLVRKGGRVVLVSQCPDGHGLGRWVQRLGQADLPAEVLGTLRDRYAPIDLALACLLTAAEQAQLLLLSDLDADEVEECFLTAITDASVVERLADEADRVVVIPHARYTLVRPISP
jgi:lactate racemase